MTPLQLPTAAILAPPSPPGRAAVLAGFWPAFLAGPAATWLPDRRPTAPPARLPAEPPGGD